MRVTGSGESRPLVDVQPCDWVDPAMWPAPFWAQKGEHRCQSVGLGAQCQRPLDHDGGHAYQGRLPDGTYHEAGWGAFSNYGFDHPLIEPIPDLPAQA